MDKPLGIVINTILVSIMGFLLVLGAFGITVFTDVFTTWFSIPFEPFVSMIPVISSIMVAIAILYFVLAYLVYTGESISWGILCFLYIGGILFNVYLLLFNFTTIIPLVIQCMLLASLLHVDTIKYVNPYYLDWKGWELD